MRATPIRSRVRDIDLKVEYAVFWASRNSQLLLNKQNVQLFQQLGKAQRGCITKTMSAQVGSKVDYFRKQEVYELFASCIADSLPSGPPSLQPQPATVLVVPGSLGAGAASNGGIYLVTDLRQSQRGIDQASSDQGSLFAEGAPGFLPPDMLLAIMF